MATLKILWHSLFNAIIIAASLVFMVFGLMILCASIICMPFIVTLKVLTLMIILALFHWPILANVFAGKLVTKALASLLIPAFFIFACFDALRSPEETKTTMIKFCVLTMHELDPRMVQNFTDR